jgi:hypothetical protein
MIGWTGKASLKCMTAPPAADGNTPPFNKTGHPLRRAFQSFAEIGPEVHLRKSGPRRNQNVGYPQSILESVGRRFGPPAIKSKAGPDQDRRRHTAARKVSSSHTGSIDWNLLAGAAVQLAPALPVFPANREFCKIAASGTPETGNSSVVTGHSTRIPYSRIRELFCRNRESWH